MARKTSATSKPRKATTKRASKPRTTSKAKPVHADVSARYGVRGGSKVSIAAAMFEEGCKMADVKKEIGITQYNFLSRMSARGHEVTRDEDGTIVLKWNKDAS